MEIQAVNSKSIAALIAALFLCLQVCRPSVAQTEEDWAWVNNHYGSVLEELLPIEQRLGLNIGFRSYRDLHPEIMEYSFVLNFDYPSNKVSAVQKVADTGSVYDQLMALHRQRPEESIESLKKQIKITESHLTQAQCPAIRTLFFQFDKIQFHAPSPWKITLHPMIYEIKSGVAGGSMYLTFVEENQPIVGWSLRVKKAIKNCLSLREGRGKKRV